MLNYYKENQRFTQIWLWAVLIISTVPVIGFITYGFFYQLTTGNPWGNNPMSDVGLIIVTIFTWVICGGIFLVLFSSELQFEIKDQAVYYRFTIFSPRLKKLVMNDIESWNVRKYGIFEYGGYGVRHSLGKKTAFVVKGNTGLELKLKDGRTIMIGTQRPEEVRKVMQNEWNRSNNKMTDG